jgi:hypothetical protein
MTTQGAAYMVNGQELALGQFPSIKDVLQAAAAEHQDQVQEVNGEVRSRRDSICSRWDNGLAFDPVLWTTAMCPRAEHIFPNALLSSH